MDCQKNPSTIRSTIITQAIAIFGCIVVPILVTMIAPRITVRFDRHGDHVSAHITKHVLLMVPLPTVVIDPVQEVRSHVTAGEHRRMTNEDRRRGRAEHVLADGSFFVSGPNSEYQVQSTPEAAPIQTSQLQAFLDDPASQSLEFTSTAGWKLSYLLGGIMTALAAFYCICAILATLKWIFQSLRSLLHFDNADEFRTT